MLDLSKLLLLTGLTDDSRPSHGSTWEGMDCGNDG
jgi:hypothetical protein